MADAQSTVPAPTAPAERPRLAYHAIVGVAIGFVSLVTLFAWPFAILTGIVIGRSDYERSHGFPRKGTFVKLLAVTGGVLAMLIFGAILGGILSFFVAALAAYSERLAGNLTPDDRTMTRIVLVLSAVATWIVLVVVLKLNVNIKIG